MGPGSGSDADLQMVSHVNMCEGSADHVANICYDLVHTKTPLWMHEFESSSLQVAVASGQADIGLGSDTGGERQQYGPVEPRNMVTYHV